MPKASAYISTGHAVTPEHPSVMSKAKAELESRYLHVEGIRWKASVQDLARGRVRHEFEAEVGAKRA